MLTEFYFHKPGLIQDVLVTGFGEISAFFEDFILSKWSRDQTVWINRLMIKHEAVLTSQVEADPVQFATVEGTSLMNRPFKALI